MAETTAQRPGPDKSFAKGLALLEALARSPRPRGVSDLARELAMTKSNAYRLLQTLAAAGFVARDGDSAAYAASLKLWELGVAVVGRIDVRQVAHPHLTQLAEATGETVHLSILDRHDVLYVDKVESSQPVRAYSSVGGRAPAHCVATGKALLAHAPAAQVAQVLSRLEPHTPKTITDPAVMERELARIRAEGWAANLGEWRETVCGIAAPVRDSRGEVVAAVGISGPTERLRPRQMKAMAPVVVAAAAAISRQLGAPV
ncbi:IclR family transcriptional regulator [Humitalea sp. 24SJ18S-53]|uniref:IclR family transcriptional regulator n=1 Tax=Humitalea sp. 24SJ18S-53 TaxID=3422307 RepID=UPI003D67031B